MSAVLLADTESCEAEGTASERLAELEGVTKRYGERAALDRFSLHVSRGEVLSLLGSNGAGKSTAISLMMGLQQPDEGTARLFGRAPSDLVARRRIGVMMQQALLAGELTVREHLQLVATYYPNPMAPGEVIELVEIAALARRNYGELSLGQKRQVQFAIAVCGRPELLFLDEPTVGLDLHAREAMWRTIRQLVAQGCSVLLTTHHIEEAEALADRVMVIAEGRNVTDGTVGQIRDTVERVQITCGTDLSSDEVGGWPEVAMVERQKDELVITARTAEPVVRRLLDSAPSLRRLEVRRAGLSEAIAELTRRAR